jgi:DNA (cytosine-5)-methyltransferase 1
MDLGIEAAGWRTVSFSEIDPYASAVLAERWPDVANLGDITDLARAEHGSEAGERETAGRQQAGSYPDRVGWTRADLWTGGFPCQDLSVAGKRAGFTSGERSVLAFTFLDLVERYRPAAILLENVPGLLSSNDGRDMGRLLQEMAELGYGVAWRVLDARHFGVPQRRRRVFILGLRSQPDDPSGHLAAERAAAVLAVGTRCGRHPAKGGSKGADAPDRFADGVGGAGALPQAVTSKWYRGTSGPAGDEHHNLICPPADARGDGAPDGLAGRLDDCAGVEVWTKRGRAQSADAPETWGDGTVMPTLNSFDTGDSRATALVAPTVNANKTGGWRYDADQAESLQVAPADGPDDPLLPLGLDSHRYRCCGNGVVAPVAFWIARRLAAAMTASEEEAA